MTVLKNFCAPREVIEDGELFRERIAGTASGLLTLLGNNADPMTSREHILLSNILSHAWQRGSDLDLPTLIRTIQNPPFDKVGVFDLESFFPASERTKLSMSLNNLLASPAFAGWLEGQPLDIKNLLYTSHGKPRLSIISIAHLNDTERMFFVTILLNELLSWMRTQPGTSSLRALFYMDEVYGYFPPSAKPPSKPPMMVLLKQARAFGLGIALATQNPVDLDYKGLANIGTWFLGRLQTERDRNRIIEGLEGAAAQSGTKFDKAAMSQILAALGSRVFLMHNVHDDGPTVFSRGGRCLICVVRFHVGKYNCDEFTSYGTYGSSDSNLQVLVLLLLAMQRLSLRKVPVLGFLPPLVATTSSSKTRQLYPMASRAFLGHDGTNPLRLIYRPESWPRLLVDMCMQPRSSTNIKKNLFFTAIRDRCLNIFGKRPSNCLRIPGAINSPGGF